MLVLWTYKNVGVVESEGFPSRFQKKVWEVKQGSPRRVAHETGSEAEGAMSSRSCSFQDSEISVEESNSLRMKSAQERGHIDCNQ